MTNPVSREEPKMLQFDAAEDGGALCCPGCGCTNLHHHQVEVRERNSEDKPGTLTRVFSSLHFSPPPLAPFHIDLHRPHEPETQVTACDKFAGRRNDVRIRFWCEQCECRPVLLLMQHKGTTYLHWESP